MPAEERAPEPVTAREESARVSHFRRWYLRPWFLLLVAIVLPLGASAYSLGMRAWAAKILDLDNKGKFVTPASLLPIEKYLTFLPPACYQRLKSARIVLLDHAWTGDLQRQLRWFPEVTDLDLHGSKDLFSYIRERNPHDPVPEPFNFDLSYYVNLNSLGIFAVRLSERSLAQLSRCPQLTSLSLQRSVLTLPMVQQLGRLRTLKSLSFSNCDLTDELLNRLEGMNQLESLWFAEPAITDQGLQVLRHFSKLRSVALNNITMSDRSFSVLNRLPLNSLVLVSVCASDAEFRALSVPMPTLVLINMDMPVTDAALDTVARHPNLEWIRIDSSQVPIEAATRLRGLTHLKTLKLNRKEIELPIGTVPKLQK